MPQGGLLKPGLVVKLTVGVLVALSPVLVACGNGGSDLTGAEIAVLEEIADSIESEGYQRPVFPAYLPDKIVAESHFFQKLSDQISYTLLGEAGTSTTDRTAPVEIVVNQYRDSTNNHECAPDETNCVEVRGARIPLEIVESEGEIVYSIGFSARGRDFLMMGIWTVPVDVGEGTKASLQREFLKTVESMFPQ